MDKKLTKKQIAAIGTEMGLFMQRNAEKRLDGQRTQLYPLDATLGLGLLDATTIPVFVKILNELNLDAKYDDKKYFVLAKW
jgi:hypothetical protein